MTARWITADVFDGLATLEDGSVDLVITSPPFLALRSYLPADHPDKGKEIGSEPTPAAFIDVMLAVTAELRRVLAPHGSICVELGDTYAGANSSGDRLVDSQYRGPSADGRFHGGANNTGLQQLPATAGEGWPLAKSKTLIPELYRLALAYGINPLTGQESPAGRWRVRNTVTWCRPNPPVGALGDKWRPATSDIVIACTSDKRYWDDIATRRPSNYDRPNLRGNGARASEVPGQRKNMSDHTTHPAGRPLYDYWEIPPGGYSGSHYAVFPKALVEPLIKAMAPPKVCQTCGEPSRRILKDTTAMDFQPAFAAHLRDRREAVGVTYDEIDSWFGYKDAARNWERVDIQRIPPASVWLTLKERLGLSDDFDDVMTGSRRWSESLTDYEFGNSENQHQKFSPGAGFKRHTAIAHRFTSGWSDCGHDDWRPAHILDCFGGSGTTGVVGTGHGHNVTLIDLDERNAELARERIGPMFFHSAQFGDDS